MKHRLQVYGLNQPPLDESLVLPSDARPPVPAPTLAIVADGGEDISEMVAAAEQALGERALFLSVGDATEPGADPPTGAELDARLVEAYGGAEGRVVLAVGPELPARMAPTLLVLVTGGRSLVRLAPATRCIFSDANLVLSEGRPGVGRGLAAALLRRICG